MNDKEYYSIRKMLEYIDKVEKYTNGFLLKILQIMN